jgi:tetratricopeptide (TPR) repeat protein
VASFTRIIELSPNRPYELHASYFNRALARATLGEFESALSDANESIRFAPEEAHTYGLRGRIHEMAGEFPEALADVNRAVAMDPRSWTALDVRSRILTSTLPVRKQTGEPKQS